MAKVTFDNRDNAFFQTLKKNVDQYFRETGSPKTGDWRLFIKTFILLGSAGTLYVMLMNNSLPIYLAIPMCIALGFNLASIGFAIMHDANHGSYSTKPWLNDLLGLTMNMMGASAFFWKQKHNIIHHTYTNVDGIDDDIAKSPIIRQCESQRWVPAHKYQHLYLFPAYALSAIFWVFIMDFKKYFSHKIFTTPLWKMTLKNHIIFWATKVFYITAYIAIPIAIWGWVPALVGYLITMAALGLTLSIVFQMAHVVEKTEFETVAIDETRHIETAWAEHELRTTANFAMNNPVISWFVGGLNFQIEHHLFPRVSHVHYPAISRIVQSTCRQFGMPYHYYPTFMEAFASHLRLMHKLGQSEKVPGKSHMRSGNRAMEAHALPMAG